MVPSIAQSIAFGVGTSSESLSDVRLQFETERSDIALTSFDFVNNKLIFKGPVPDDFSGKIQEIGLYSMAASSIGSSIMISSFDSQTEDWMTGSSNPTFTTANARIGDDSLNHSPAASGSSTSTLGNILLDLSEYSAADIFNIAFSNNNANASSISFKMKSDDSNYYTYTIGAPATGYQFATLSKGSGTVTGSPDWGNITSIDVTTNAKASGAANVDFEGLRMEDTDTINPDYILVARKVLATPYIKQPNMTQEVEFSLDINI